MAITPHTRWFRNVDEVEYMLGYTFTPEQAELVGIYIFTGMRPDPGGCWTCTPAYIRTITGEIDEFENRLDRGEETWAWPTSQ